MTLLIILLIIFFAYAFAGVVGFIPFLGGLIYGFFEFLINLVSSFIYPVGFIPKLLVGGTLIFVIVMFFIKLFTKNH